MAQHDKQERNWARSPAPAIVHSPLHLHTTHAARSRLLQSERAAAVALGAPLASLIAPKRSR